MAGRGKRVPVAPAPRRGGAASKGSASPDARLSIVRAGNADGISGTMRRRNFLVAVVAALALAGASPAQGLAQGSEAFVSTIEDLPLMPGLVEEAGGVVFDSPGGRIVEAFAIGEVSEGEVRAFYGETLPQLGWRALDVGVYQRESEILKVEFPGGPGAPPPLTVGFTLSPKAP